MGISDHYVVGEITKEYGYDPLNPKDYRMNVTSVCKMKPTEDLQTAKKEAERLNLSKNDSNIEYKIFKLSLIN